MIAELAISGLTADKLPFTPNRLNAGPLVSRIAWVQSVERQFAALWSDRLPRVRCLAD